MLEDIINRPDLKKYVTNYDVGQIIFLEGDNSEDLYLLISGSVDIFKGQKKISEITKEGSLFGEMSFFLGARRTATVKASSDVEALRVPKDALSTLLNESPEITRQIATLLAQRLDETGQMVYGFKEFCDQLPDAVLITDRDGKILTWNSAAQNLYGTDWDAKKEKRADDIYEDPAAYRDLLKKIKAGNRPDKDVFKIRHPEKGVRFISTTTTVLYDGHHNFQGILSLGRDVTETVKIERRYKMARYWLIPSILLLLLMAAAVFYGYPYYKKGSFSSDIQKEYLRNQLAKDYLVLKSLLEKPFSAGNRRETTRLMKQFFSVQTAKTAPYSGLVLLGRGKKVFDAYSIDKSIDPEQLIGNSYTGICFEGDDRSIHKVLCLYRRDSDHPMGKKCVEVAMRLREKDRPTGWIVFQMDLEVLKNNYDMDEEQLKSFRISGP